MPVPAEPWNPTPAELQAIAQGLNVYYKLGSTISFTAPQVAGYITPTPATQSLILGQSVTTKNLVYLTQAEVNAGNTTTSATPSATTAGGTLAHTGDDMGTYALIAVVVGLIATLTLAKRKKPVSFQ